jgi:hypothetical protein
MLCEGIIQWLDVEIFNSAIAMMAIYFSFFRQKFQFKAFVRKFFLRLTGFCQSFAEIWIHSGHTKGMHRYRYGTDTKVNRIFSNRKAMHSVQIPRMHSECTPCMKGMHSVQIPRMHSECTPCMKGCSFVRSFVRSILSTLQDSGSMAKESFKLLCFVSKL